MFCLLYSPKQKVKSHVIDIFISEDMENISLSIFQYLTLYNKREYHVKFYQSPHARRISYINLCKNTKKVYIVSLLSRKIC
jgi:hypothetical protein